LKEYKNAKFPPPSYVVTPFRTPNLLTAAALTNSIVIDGLPDMLTPRVTQPFSAPTERALINTVKQAENAIYAPVPRGFSQPDTVKSSVVALTFSQVYAALTRNYGEEVQDILPQALWTQRVAHAYWGRDNMSIQIIGRTDGTMTVKTPIPPVPNMMLHGALENSGVEQLEAQLEFADSNLKGGVVFDPYDKEGPWIRRKDDIILENKSAFSSKSAFPALSVLVEFKPVIEDSGLGQLLVYQAASSVANAVWQPIPSSNPALQFAVLSTGRSYVFTAFQLNTVNFDSGNDSSLRNVFWCARKELISSTNKVNIETLAYLYRLLEYVYETQVPIGLTNQTPLLP